MTGFVLSLFVSAQCKGHAWMVISLASVPVYLLLL